MKINKNKAAVGLAGISAISIAFAGMAGFSIGGQASAATTTCNPSATTIAEAKCMQDINDSVIASMTENVEYSLTDSRDDQAYYIAKLEDGNVWMTQNLGLWLSQTKSLTSAETDLNDATSAAYQDGYSVSNGLISWTPARSTVSFNGASVEEWTDSYAEPGSANKTNSTNTGHSSFGEYYNWTAAIASNDSSSLTQDTVSDITNNPKNSICPKGWRLPTVSSQSETLLNSTNEFSRINKLYNNDSSSDYSLLTIGPLYFVKAGIVSNNNYQYLEGSAVYWSSTIQNPFSAYGMSFGENTVDGNNITIIDMSSSVSRRVGGSIRCVARTGISPETPESPGEETKEETVQEAEEDSSIAVPNTGSNIQDAGSSNGSILITALSIMSITTAIAAIACRISAKNHRKFDL